MSKKTCFVIAPIGEAESDTRKRSDQVLRHIISPAVESCGYSAIRADQISEPGLITSQVIQHIVDDPLVVADLTERNPNVFYELAIRHAIKKPLVQIIKKGEQIPFDVAGTRTIHVDHHDLDSVEEAKKEIENQIKALEKDTGKLETPISVSLDLQFLRQSENPEQRSLGDILSAITDIRSSVSMLEKRFSKSDMPFSHEMLKEIEYRRMQEAKMRHLGSELRHIASQLIEKIQEDKSGTKDEKNNKLNKIENLQRIMEMSSSLATL